ncbi:MAG: DUF2997 domain-containing protein [Prevotella sp.]|nr:DUF2997 domain-containing protein [Prevotella sp.]MBP5506640.1 DUF2997 domain-containing protein [Prevotella sp.]
MAKQIKIRIFPDGHIETVTKNIKGKQCLKYLQPLEQLLDAQVTDSEFTSEYYEAEVEETTSETVNVNNINT